METVCKLNQCTGCNACVNSCKLDAIQLIDNMKSMNAVIDMTKCVNCDVCKNVCPNNNAVEKHEQIYWKQGWAKEIEMRNSGSSGGIASALISSFIENRGYVCSCIFSKGKFKFICTNDLKEAKKFAGSKYVKSYPENVAKEIKKHIEDGKKVLFIGLPCQVAGMLNFIPKRFHDKLYTIDLICHGTPSHKLFEWYLEENNVNILELKDIKFRYKGGMGLNIKGLSMPGTVDRYLISFLQALNYTENCYECQYSTINRVSDLTLGDNWGTDLQNEMLNGVSLIGCQTEKGCELLDMTKLTLCDVDIEKSKKENGNLVHPSVAPKFRDEFFVKVNEGENYNRLIFKYFPKQCVRQMIKGVAIKLKLKSVRGGYRIVFYI